MSCGACTGTLRKRVDERLDWRFDFAPFLDGDTIISADTAIVDGLDVAASVEDGSHIMLRIGGGTLREAYKVPLKVTTEAGRVHTECIKVRITK